MWTSLETQKSQISFLDCARYIQALDSPRLWQILDHGPQALTDNDAEGKTLLHLACHKWACIFHTLLNENNTRRNNALLLKRFHIISTLITTMLGYPTCNPLRVNNLGLTGLQIIAAHLTGRATVDPIIFLQTPTIITLLFKEFKLAIFNALCTENEGQIVALEFGTGYCYYAATLPPGLQAQHNILIRKLIKASIASDIGVFEPNHAYAIDAQPVQQFVSTLQLKAQDLQSLDEIFAHCYAHRVAIQDSLMRP